jgi:hypothetical protein
MQTKSHKKPKINTACRWFILDSNSSSQGWNHPGNTI